MRTIHTTSEEETTEAGKNIAAELRVGDVVLIDGPLGAGKTAFVRGLAEGLGADPNDVSSPTFTILQQYGGSLPLYHADLYRLTPAEVTDLGLEETGLDGILAVEWPDRWAERPMTAHQVAIDDQGGDDRRIRIRR
ncbi:MAG: tRNA (adenosine(37)-N6)-threonylcarbamoyltransferase complex ATPase subunit type 1 TsaE [Acidobacteria bacterium]|nr:tRNA (adenosine(37)-N6)-threonylcarbamoyltransferase complex ATPase subunit type 1 TsaE [Acidobacteriota bacterium]